VTKSGSVQFLAKKLTKIKFWKTGKFKTEPVQTDRFRFSSVRFFLQQNRKTCIIDFLGFFRLFGLSNGFSNGLVIDENII
jgi:hypothetical protein